MLEILKNTRSHPTAEWLYQELKKDIPNVSLGTVYRNLNTLIEQGEVKKISTADNFDRFEAVIGSHYHFSCNRCGKVYDVFLPIDEEINKMAGKETGFLITDHNIQFYGICKDCQ